MDDTVSATWRALVDLERLAAWMDQRGLQRGAPIDRAEPLGGGTQNLLLRFERGGRAFVLRRPPPHPRVDGSQTVRREARVLTAIANTRVPHPTLIAACDDVSVIGAGFFLMEPVDGYAPTAGLPSAVAGDGAWCHRLGCAMAEAIAELGAIDPAAVGLADFGRTEGWVDRQVPRWRAQLDGYAEYAGWPGPRALPGIDDVARWLAGETPRTFRPGILHGDFHLGNVMFRRAAPELAALVDWELASLGDPLLDLGWLIATWPDAHGRTVIDKLEVRPWHGFPSAAELAEVYASQSGRDLRDLRWYTVLALYKLAIVIEGTHARAHSGKAPMTTGVELHSSARRAIGQALQIIDTEV